MRKHMNEIILKLKQSLKKMILGIMNSDKKNFMNNCNNYPYDYKCNFLRGYYKEEMHIEETNFVYQLNPEQVNAMFEAVVNVTHLCDTYYKNISLDEGKEMSTQTNKYLSIEELKIELEEKGKEEK